MLRTKSEGQMAMKKTALLVGFLICFILNVSAAAVPLGSKLSVAGTLRVLIAPATVTASERREIYFAIVLNAPISIEGCNHAEDFCENSKAVMVMQLVLDDEEIAFFEEHLNQQVLVSGTIFGSHTGHHFTDFLLDVKNIASR